MHDIIPDQKNQSLSVKNLIVFIQGMFGKINVNNGHYIGARWRLRDLYGHDIVKGFHII